MLGWIDNRDGGRQDEGGGFRNGQALVLSQGTQCVGGDQGRNLRASVQKFQARPLLPQRTGRGRAGSAAFGVDDAGAHPDRDRLDPGSHTQFGAGLLEVAVDGSRGEPNDLADVR